MVLGCGCLASKAAADWLGTLFPPGVPGYNDEPGVTVQSRLHPETQPQGVRDGPWLLQSAWQESVGYDSNVLGGSAPLGSWTVNTQPSLLLSSTWSRAALGAYVELDNRRDLNAPGQNRTDGNASLGGTLNFGQDRLTLAAAEIDSHEDRTALDALPTDRPVPFQVQDLRASYAWTHGRWVITPNMEAAVWHYGSATILGVPASQAYRDRDVFQGGATVGYELAPQRSLVMVARAIGQDYQHAQPGQPSLNSTGYQLLAGMDYADDGVWRYRLLLGAEHRDFAAAAYPSRTAAITEAEIAWLPSGMTTLAATVSRTMEDAAQEGVSGYTLTSARVTADHELRRDFLLHASAGMQRADFLQGGTWQAGFTLGLGATWLVNRHVEVSATYDFTDQHGSSSTAALPLSGDYTRNVGLLTVRLAL